MVSLAKRTRRGELTPTDVRGWSEVIEVRGAAEFCEFGSCCFGLCWRSDSPTGSHSGSVVRHLRTVALISASDRRLAVEAHMSPPASEITVHELAARSVVGTSSHSPPQPHLCGPLQIERPRA